MVDLVGLTTNTFAGLRHLGDGPIFERLRRLAPADRPDYFAVYDLWFPDLVRLPGFLTRVYSSHLLRNTITSGDDVPVYLAHWDAVPTADLPVLDHAADAVEQPSTKVVSGGEDAVSPYYLAHLVVPAPRT